MKICSKCKAEFNSAKSKYLCGYGKCETCCLSCGHRNHPNPEYIDPSMKAIDFLNAHFTKLMNEDQKK